MQPTPDAFRPGPAVFGGSVTAEGDRVTVELTVAGEPQRVEHLVVSADGGLSWTPLQPLGRAPAGDPVVSDLAWQGSTLVAVGRAVSRTVDQSSDDAPAA